MAGKVVAVFGATGQQGGSVARALLASGGKYKVRAITRNPESEAAKKLKEMGAEVVVADADDKASIQKAVTGAYGCFGVTNFWAHMDAKKEEQQGKNIADACKAAGVKHLVYSGVENVKKIMDIDCPHFDGKGRVEEYLQNIDVPFTSVRLAAYMENFLSFFTAQKIGEGKYAIFVPMGNKPLPMVTVADVGVCVHRIFDQPNKYLGKFLGLANDEKTIKEIAQIMSRHLGKDVVDGEITADNYAKLGFPGAGELANMFKFYLTDKCIRDIKLTKELNPAMTDFEPWVKANKEALLNTFK